MDEKVHEEIKALHRNKTRDLVELLKARKSIENKWIYKIKCDGNDQVRRYRARLIVKGYTQKRGIDFNEIFSLYLEQLDVKTAFFHGEIEEDIYMLQPERSKEEGKENLVCRLTKSLYG